MAKTPVNHHHQTRMNLLDLPEEVLLSILSHLPWSSLWSTASTCSQLLRLAEDPTLHTSSSLTLDTSLVLRLDNKAALHFLFPQRRIMHLTITSKQGLAGPGQLATLVAWCCPIAGQVELLDVRATVTERDLGPIQVFPNLKRLGIKDLYSLER